MSDAASKRRELRRKKILGDSEGRMRKVAGEFSESEIKESNNVYSENNSEAWVTNAQDIFEPEEDNSSPPDAHWLNGLTKNSELIRDADFDSIDSTNNEEVISTENSLLTPNSSHEIKKDNSLEVIAFNNFRIIASLILGIFIRLTFLIEFGSNYVQSIFYPFMAFEIVLIGYQLSVQMDIGSGQSGLWLMILQLSGIGSDIVDKYKKVMGVVTCGGNDFMLYFFSFIVTHSLLAYCL